MKTLDVVSIAETIKQSVSAVQVGAELGLSPNRAGFCRCPLHGDHDASLKLYGNDRGWCCFGCHKGGDVIRLVQEVRDCSFWSAVEWLDRAFHLGLPLTQPIDQNAQEAAEIARKRRSEEMETQRQIDAAQFDLYMAAQQFVTRLEAMTVLYRPMRLSDPIDARFCLALNLLPDAREAAERIAVKVIGRKRND